MSKNRRMTLKAVADYLGVSHTTVSMVINNHPRISPKTRQRVLEAIRKFNFYPNLAARHLVRSRTDTIGVVGTMFAEPYTVAPYYVEILHGLETETRALRVDLKLYNATGEAEDYENLYRKIVGERRTDAVVLLSTPFSAKVLETFQTEGVPIVVFRPQSRDFTLPISVPLLEMDDAAGFESVVQHLLDLGHRRIGLINGPSHWTFCRDRRLGYEKALRERGVEIKPQYMRSVEKEAGALTAQTGEELATQLLREHPEITALACVADLVAWGAIRAARRLGRRVPQDLSVTGYDDVYLAKLADPPLTTVRQPLFEMGREAARLAKQLACGEPVPAGPRYFSTELRVRESTAPPSK